MKIFLLMKSSIRKNKSSSITLAFLIFLATILLYLSFMILFELDHVVDNINEKNQGADYLVMVPETISEVTQEKLSNMENYESVEIEKAVSSYGTIQNKRVEKTAQNMELIYLNENQKRTMSKLNILDEAKERTKNSIIVPYSLKASYGYETGDEIEIKINGEIKKFKIYGFLQDVLFSTAMNIEDYILYVDEEEFHTLYSEAPENMKKSYIKVRLTEGADTTAFDSEFVKQTLTSKDLEPADILQLDYDNMKTGTTTMIHILAMVLVAFALLLVFISLIVIRFTIITHIEEDIKNIGSMEAAGFTSKMLRKALVFQFMFIVAISFVLGILCAVLCSDAFTNVVSTTIGLRWNADVSVRSLALTFLILFLFIILIAVKVSGRIKKITPMVALRSGLSTYNFKKNYFPLENTNGNLDVVLGLKQMLHAGKQNTSICLISVIMSFIVIASFTILNNFTGENSKLIQMVGLEKSDITITCSSEDECKEVMEQLKDYSEIRKMNRFDYTDVILSYEQKEISTCANVCEDYSELEVSTLSEGRFPRHENEIALTYLNAKKLGVELGDVVTLKGKDGDFDYIVVGFTQHINHLGCSCSLTRAGMLRSNQNYFESMIYVYTKADVKVSTFLKTLENDLGHDTLSYINMDDAFNNTLSSVKTACELICALLAGIAVIVISIILFYLVKVKLTRNKVLFGIQKAIGFTTRQLVVQNVISFCVVQFISFLIGGVMTILFATPLCTVMFSVCDFKKCTMELSLFIIVASIAVLTIFSVLVTTIVSIRIRKINPRQLFMD